MVFSSFDFLILFLPSFLFLYLISKNAFKNYILLLFSLLFYYYGEGQYIFLLLLSIVANYGIALLIVFFKDKVRLSFLTLSFGVALNLAMLGYLKYANFFIENLNGIFKISIEQATIIMPIGISFYTFQAISYIVDVYRGGVNVNKNVFDVALYISMFPQLIAGPIVRYSTIAEEVKCRKHYSMTDFSDGIFRFSIGLAKKILIADTMATCADGVFNIPINEVNASLAWIGILAYTLQIYFDFSAYSDMAIGLGRMMGFHFLENFNYPYIATSITDFWRRWHISLSSFLRDYLYIPLGGNRKGKTRTYINLFIVFLLCGFWHGASWNFIVWGAWFGTFLFLEKVVGLEKNILFQKFPLLGNCYTMLVVIIGWVFFRTETLADAGNYLLTMFGVGNGYSSFLWYDYLTHVTMLFAVIGCIFSTPVYPSLVQKLKDNNNPLPLPLFKFSTVFLLLILVSFNLTAGAYSPFLYFRF